MLLRVRQLAALLITLVILGGIPYLLTAVVTWPQVDLSWVSVQAHLRGGRLPPGTLTSAAFGALWVAWSLYLIAVGAEVANWLRRGRMRRRPLGPLQILAATALGTLATTGAAAPGLVETAVTAPQHEDTTENSEHSESAASQPEQDTDLVYEQRDRHRTIDGFGYDSAEVDEQMRTDLGPTIDLISQHGAPDTPIVVVGHTDAAGDPDYNQELSERRAEAIADHLRDALGENAPLVETQGHGHDDLLADATDAEQRRAEIIYTITTPTHPEPDPASEVEPVSTDNTDEGQGETQERAVVLHLPSGAVAGLAAGAAASVGAAGGYLLGTRRSPTRAHPEGRTPTTPAAPGDDPEPPDEKVTREPSAAPASPPDTAPQMLPSRVLDALAQAPGVGLQGDADGAARTLLATALATDDSAPNMRLVMCGDDARQLLGEETADLLAKRDTPNVALTESGPAALRLLHTTLVERQHQLDQADTDTLDELPTHEEASPIPPVVLLTHHGPDHEADLAGLLLGAEGLDVTAVILGRWPLGGTLTIDHDAVTEASSPLSSLHGATWPPTAVQHIRDLLHEHPLSDTQGPPEPNESVPAETTDPGFAPTPETAGPPLPPDDEAESARAADEAEGSAAIHAPAQEPPEGGPPAEADTPSKENSPPRAAGDQCPIRVQLMSRIQITVDGARVEVPRRAAYELAAYLAVHHNDGVRLERAVTDMWPDEDPRRIQRRFHDAARALRHLGPRETGGDPVIRDGGLYRLNPALISVDLWDLETALADAEHSDDREHRHALIQRAADLYAGDLAAEADYAWIEPARAHLRERATDTLRRHAATLTDHPDVATAVLQRAVDLHPDDEQTHTTLIRHLLSHHHTGEARRAYTTYTEHMRTLGIQPDPKMRELLEKARTQ